MTYGSLFSGIGGMDLGLDRAGMTCKWQVEIDPFCRKVLEKHWPNVRRYEDVRTVGAELERVDLIAGGFPCQDLSVAGLRRGIKEGTRSGLWMEFARIIGDLRPRFVLIENVSGLLANEPMRRVLGDLSALGYDAEWESIAASAFGATHVRERIIIVAYPDSHNGKFQIMQGEKKHQENNSWTMGGKGEQERNYRKRQLTRCFGGNGWWDCKPGMDRVADGIPSQMDRLRCLGNAVVPQVAEWIGRRIMEAAR